MKKILFLCTGNYYRSRFAEEYFNALVETKKLDWKAYSKGLSQNMPSNNNPGPISVHALEALDNRKIKGKSLRRYPRPVIESDFMDYDRIIALSEAEHRPMLEERFDQHLDKVAFFEVGDLPLEEPKEAMNKVALYIETLIDKLAVFFPNKAQSNINP